MLFAIHPAPSAPGKSRTSQVLTRPLRTLLTKIFALITQI